MANITHDELNTFKSITTKQVIESMELYLIGNNGRTMNMAEVGRAVFGSDTYSQRVSLIHRIYNFSGQNGGKYAKGCDFERRYGYKVTKADIQAFVRKYPNGTYDNGVTFDDFLLSRISGATGGDRYSEYKIGKLAQVVLKRMLQEGKASDREVANMQQAAYSKKTFDLQFPLLVRADSFYDATRYYSDPVTIRGVQYKLCSQWFETPANNDRPYLIRWIENHMD